MYFSKSTGGFYTDDIHRDNIPSDAVEITTDMHATLLAGQAGGKHIVGDDNGGPILVDPPAATIDYVWMQIKAERDLRKVGGFKVEVAPGEFKWFHGDVYSRTQHLGLKDKARDLLAAGGSLSDPIQADGQDVEWKTMDGTFVVITAQLAFDLVEAAGDADAKIHLAAEVHRAAMEASGDPGSYDFSGGWPLMYGE